MSARDCRIGAPVARSAFVNGLNTSHELGYFARHVGEGFHVALGGKGLCVGFGA